MGILMVYILTITDIGLQLGLRNYILKLRSVVLNPTEWIVLWY